MALGPQYLGLAHQAEQAGRGTRAYISQKGQAEPATEALCDDEVAASGVAPGSGVLVPAPATDQTLRQTEPP
jgi:hypothetical protein